MLKRCASFDELPLFLTVEEFAEVMGISMTTAYGFVRSKRVKSIRIGNQYRIPKESLLALTQSQPNS